DRIQPCDVRQADDAFDASLAIRADDPRDAVLRHQVARKTYIVLRIARHDFIRNEGLDGRARRIALGDDANRDIAIRDRADRTHALVADRQKTDILISHP